MSPNRIMALSRLIIQREMWGRREKNKPEGLWFSELDAARGGGRVGFLVLASSRVETFPVLFTHFI